MSGSGREALPNVRELSVGPPECAGVVERTSQMSGSGLEALPDVWELSEGLPRCPGVVGRAS